jgi:glutamate synthase (NADPH/NADH) large chain
VATQDPTLRQLFPGKPEHVVNFMMFIAEEVRELMAKLGFRTWNEMVGQTDRIRTKSAIEHWKADGIDLSRVLHKPEAPDGVAIFNSEQQDHHLEEALDNELIAQAMSSLEHQTRTIIDTPISNTNRSVGAMLSGEVARRFGHTGLLEDTIHINLKGTAGQSFGAWLANGITLHLTGDANDYVGKGLSGGRLIVQASPEGTFIPKDNVIIGNTALYGAISGECYFNGGAGERFAVRNSGAIAVVEAVGDHGCEYMTGGCVLVLGATGRNFAAGMSGGIAYVLDEDGVFAKHANLSMVELEPIDPTSYPLQANENPDRFELMADPLRYDAWRIRHLLATHGALVDSSRAREICEDFDTYVTKFVKVVPIEYRRAIEERDMKAGAA